MHHCSRRQPRGGGLCESRPEPPQNLVSFTFLHLNLRGFISHSAELSAHLRIHDFPHIVGITETLLDASVATSSLSGYTLVSRLDRRTGRGGGIMLFARVDIACSVVHIADSETFERSWHILHSDRGPLLLALWYRPPAYGEISSILALRVELEKYRSSAIGTIIAGDMNVHNRPWLRHSRGNTPEGRELFNVCTGSSLVECVQQPTRGPYLLDLVLSDLDHLITAEVAAGVSDHSLVFCRLAFSMPHGSTITRNCFYYQHAQWSKLSAELSGIDWRSLLPSGDADAAAAIFAKTLLSTAKRFIPFKALPTLKTNHPWLNDRCMQLVADKCRAFGTDQFAAKQAACSQGLLNEYTAFISSTRSRLESLPSSSKRWWSLSGSLLLKASRQSSVPPLKHTDGNWALSAIGKANLLSATFAAKARLLEAETNEYSEITDPIFLTMLSGFIPIRARRVVATLEKLNIDSGTGPDDIPARILKMCSAALARPVAILIRIILSCGRWPLCWKVHWVFPLFKKKTKSDPANYRGIHLTSQVSKVVERVLGVFFQPFLEATSAYGPNQFAYMKRRGAKDALALNVLSWLTMINSGLRVGLYCSDVSGAFDRVSADRLLLKLKAKGVHDQLLKVIGSWLGQRVSLVVVDGFFFFT